MNGSHQNRMLILKAALVVVWAIDSLSFGARGHDFAVNIAIRDVRATSNLEGLGGGAADFYAITRIGHASHKTAVLHNSNHIRPSWYHQVSLRRSAFTSGQQQQARWLRPTIYDHDSFRGSRFLSFVSSLPNLHKHRSRLGDRVSSVYVPAGYQLVMYEGSNYRGRKLTIKGPSQYSDLKRNRPAGANWGDRISSIAVKRMSGSSRSKGVYLEIKLMEKDGGGRGGDDLVDVTPERGSVLQLVLYFDPQRRVAHIENLVTGRIVGKLRRTRGGSWEIHASSSGRGGDRASIRYSVSVKPISGRSSVKQIKTLMLNAQFLPHVVRNSRRDADYRADEIARRIQREGYDFAVLNELFSNSKRRRLIRKLRSEWRRAGKTLYHYGPPDERDLHEDGGVVIVSRFPIIEKHQLVYKDKKGPDGWANKGILHARLALDGSHTTDYYVDVFATHLQADNHESTRRLQLKEIRTFVRRHSDSRHPCLLMGDMNIRGALSDRRNSRSEYRTMMAILTDARPFQDLWPTLKSTAGNTSRPLDPKTGKRIDYIFIANSMRPIVRLLPQRVSINHFLDRRVKSLSDHSGIVGEFRVSH